MKKKILSLLLCASTAVTLLAGCGNESTGSDTAVSSAAPSSVASAPSDDSVEEASSGVSSGTSQAVNTKLSGNITFVSQNDTTGALDDMIKAFNKVYPNVHVDHQMSSGASDDVKKSLMTSFAAGDSDPDVIESDIIWISQFASAGWLMDLTDDLKTDSDKYLAGPLKTCYYDGKAYAYPDYTDVGLLYYRKDLVKDPPKTWDDLVKLSQENIGKNGIQYGYLFQAFQGEPTSCNTLEFIKQNGGHDLDDSGKFNFDNQNTYDALDFMKKLISDKISPEDVLSAKPDDSKAIFEEGKALFMRNWTYAYSSAQSDTSKVAGKVGVAALPVGPDGKESSGTLGGWNFAINAKTDAPDASKAFVKFMSDYDAQKIETAERSTLPTVKAVYDDQDVLKALPYLSDVKAAADAAQPRPQVKDYPTISTIFQEYFHKILTGEGDAKKLIPEMDQKLNDALSKM